MAQTTRHSPDIVLEEYAFGPEAGDVETAAHVAACSQCQATVATMREERERFLSRLPSNKFITHLEERSSSNPRGRTAVISWSGAAAVLLLGLMVVALRAGTAPDQAPRNTIRFRGQPGPQLSLFVGRDGGKAVPTRWDSTFYPGDIIRFAVSNTKTGHAHLFHLDRDQTITSCLPEDQGPAVVIPANQQTLLPGSIVLDDAPGVESFVLIVSPRPLSVAEAQNSVAGSGQVVERLDKAWPRAEVRLFSLRKATP